METAEKFNQEDTLNRLPKLNGIQISQLLRKMETSEVSGVAERIMKKMKEHSTEERGRLFSEVVESYYDRDACLLAGASYSRINDEDVARLLILNYCFLS